MVLHGPIATNILNIYNFSSKAVALEKLIDLVKSMDGIWVTTMAEIAEHTRQSVQDIHSHARIAVPGFPDTGASFTPATVRQQDRTVPGRAGAEI